jgi:peptide/nickel transport system substrate-binding protein
LDVGIETNLEIMESGQYWDLEAEKQLPPLFGDSWSSPLGEAYNRLFGALGGWDASYSSWSDPVIASSASVRAKKARSSTWWAGAWTTWWN